MCAAYVAMCACMLWGALGACVSAHVYINGRPAIVLFKLNSHLHVPLAASP